MFCLRNIAMPDYHESVTTGQRDEQTPDKVIPMWQYASQATHKYLQTAQVNVLLEQDVFVKHYAQSSKSEKN